MGLENCRRKFWKTTENRRLVYKVAFCCKNASVGTLSRQILQIQDRSPVLQRCHKPNFRCIHPVCHHFEHHLLISWSGACTRWVGSRYHRNPKLCVHIHLHFWGSREDHRIGLQRISQGKDESIRSGFFLLLCSYLLDGLMDLLERCSLVPLRRIVSSPVSEPLGYSKSSDYLKWVIWESLSTRLHHVYNHDHWWLRNVILLALFIYVFSLLGQKSKLLRRLWLTG